MKATEQDLTVVLLTGLKFPCTNLTVKDNSNSLAISARICMLKVDGLKC